MKASNLLALLPLALLSPRAADATVIVSLTPSAATVAPGNTLDLEIRADLSMDAVVGFGLDLVFDASVLALEEVLIAAPWDPVFAPDGDGLAAVAPLSGAPDGTEVLLATVTLRAVADGESNFFVAATPGDLTEGLPLAGPPGAFATFTSMTATIEVPEPRLAWLWLPLLALGLARSRRTALVSALAIGAAPTAFAQELELPAPACAGGEPVFEQVQWGGPLPRGSGTTPMSMSRSGDVITTNDATTNMPILWTEPSGSDLLPVPGATPYALSGDGSTVVGQGFLRDSTGTRIQSGFRWTQAAGTVPICQLAGVSCDRNARPNILRGAAVSNDGSVIAGLMQGDSAAYWWSAERGLEELRDPDGGPNAGVNALDGDGSRAVGWTSLPKNVQFESAGREFELSWGEYRATRWRRLESGLELDVLRGYEGCTVRLRTEGVLPPFDSGPIDAPCWSEATDISADGSVVVGQAARPGAEIRSSSGGFGPIGGGLDAVVWRNGRMDSVAHPACDGSVNDPRVSDDGLLVTAWCYDENFDRIVFVHDEAGGYRTLVEYLVENGVDDQGGSPLFGLMGLVGEQPFRRVEDLRSDPLGGLSMVVIDERGFSSAAERVWRVQIPCRDADRDRLCDSWEAAGGIDLNEDGRITPCTAGDCPDLVLAGADPRRKDVFVEVDSLIANVPLDPEAVERIVAAFANVPASLARNPSGMPGIAIHFERDEVDQTLSDGSTFWTYDDPPQCFQGPAQFDSFARLFGSPAQRTNPGVIAAKARLYRYVMYGGSALCDFAGWGSNRGHLQMLDRGDARDPDNTDNAATVLMHELGHTLGLGHGGPDDHTNYKPNYHSIMNYNWAYRRTLGATPKLSDLLLRSSWRLDFSRVAFHDLVEGPGAALAEFAGIGGHFGHWAIAGPTIDVTLPAPPFPAVVRRRVVNEFGPVDFDADGMLEAPLQGPVDLNLGFFDPDEPESPRATPDETLRSHSDWEYIAENLCSLYADPDFGAHVLDPDALPSFTPEGDLGLAVEDELFVDCNGNGIADEDDLASGLDTDTNSNGLLDACEPLLGDVDLDEDVDETDRDLLLAAFGHGEGEPEYNGIADLDDDQWITFVDYQLWLAAYEDFQAGSVAGTTALEPACGLLGAEALAPLALWALARRRRRGGSLDA